MPPRSGAARWAEVPPVRLSPSTREGLPDLAVDEGHQRRGIGRELIRRTDEAAGLHTVLILLAAPKARAYYPHVGMTRHESCWVIPRQPRPE
jgi:predicted N-acetyltransferase YhbS